MEGIQQSKLSAILLGEIMIEISKFDVELAWLELIFIAILDPFFRVEHGVEGFEVGGTFWIAKWIAGAWF